MPSLVYTNVVNTVSQYLAADKAVDCINRQVAHCNATPDSFSKEQYREVLSRVVGASTMWIGDKAKQAELKTKLEALA
jgi:hypothetical protein